VSFIKWLALKIEDYKANEVSLIIKCSVVERCDFCAAEMQIEAKPRDAP